MGDQDLIVAISNNLAKIGESIGYAQLSGFIMPYFRSAKIVKVRCDDQQKIFHEVMYVIGLVSTIDGMTIKMATTESNDGAIGHNIHQVANELGFMSKNFKSLKLDYHDPDLFDVYKDFLATETLFKPKNVKLL